MTEDGCIMMGGPCRDRGRPCHDGEGHVVTEELCRCHLCSGSITVPVSPGTAPRDSSFLLNALMVHHYQRGAWYPRGGASEIAFHTVPLIERAGGAVLVRAAVTRILVSPDGTAVGERPARGLRCGDGQQCGMGDSAGWVAVWDGWQCGMGGSDSAMRRRGGRAEGR